MKIVYKRVNKMRRGWDKMNFSVEERRMEKTVEIIEERYGLKSIIYNIRLS